MTRFPHDQFAKEYLDQLLSPMGTVETSRDIAGEVRQVDVYFTPTSTPNDYQQQAIEEITALPEDSQRRQFTKRVIV